METKRQSLNTLLDWQLSLVVKLHRGMADHDITKESCLPGDLLNALLGVEALNNAIAALPLTTEEQGQVIGSPKGQFVEQITEQETRNCWQRDLDNLPLNREPTHSFDDDDAGW